MGGSHPVRHGDRDGDWAKQSVSRSIVCAREPKGRPRDVRPRTSELYYYISLSGIITYQRRSQVPHVVPHDPITRAQLVWVRSYSYWGEREKNGATWWTGDQIGRADEVTRCLLTIDLGGDWIREEERWGIRLLWFQRKGLRSCHSIVSRIQTELLTKYFQ